MMAKSARNLVVNTFQSVEYGNKWGKTVINEALLKKYEDEVLDTISGQLLSFKENFKKLF